MLDVCLMRYLILLLGTVNTQEYLCIVNDSRMWVKGSVMQICCD